MIGQHYFDLRSRLGTALFSLGSLVPETGTDADHSVMLDSLVNSLRDAFVFVVVGEVNVGKSTFLNALFGAEFSQTGVMPTTDKICFFKYGPSVRRVSITATLDEIYVPADFLKDFHIVDTPGTNSIEGEHQEITERFVPMADLVIFVFSAMNPWAASAWQFLDKVHRHWMRHVIFVLQQSDLRTGEEIGVILDYMKQLSQQRFGREFPIFAVSGKKAFLAKTDGLDVERLMVESGFDRVEEYIARTMGVSSARVSKLANALRIAWEILGVMEQQSGARVANREAKAAVLCSIENEVAAQQERTSVKLAPAIEATESDLRLASEEIMARIHSRMTPRFALTCAWRERRTIAGLDDRILEKVKPTAVERWEKAAAIIEDDVGGFADYLSEAVSEGLKLQLREELRPDASFWKAQRRRFTDRIQQMLSRVVSGVEVEPALEIALVKSRRIAIAQWLCIMATFGAALFFASRSLWLYAGLIEGGGLLAVVLLWIASGKMLKRVCLQAEDQLSAVLPELRRLMSNQLREDMRNLFEPFERILQPTRERLSEQEKRQASLNDQLRNLAATFAGIDAELRTMASASVS